MGKEAENKRYKELESLLWQIREATKAQVDYAHLEAEAAQKSTKKANRIAIISAMAAIIAVF